MQQLRPHRIRGMAFVVFALAVMLCQACAHRVSIEFDLGTEGRFSFEHEQWQALSEQYPGAMRPNVPQGDEAVALERVLWDVGIPAVDKITVNEQTFFWQDIYEDAWLTSKGDLLLDGQEIKTKQVDVLVPWEHGRSLGTVARLAPTICDALGIGRPEDSVDASMGSYDASQVYVFAVEGLGVRYHEKLRQAVDLEFLRMLGEPVILHLDYPADSTVTLAGMLTGTPSGVHQISDGAAVGIASETLLDVLSQEAKSSVLVTSYPPAPLLAEWGARAVADSDSDGDPSSEILAAARTLAGAEDPTFMWVELPGLHIAATEYGLESAEAMAQASTLDSQLEQAVMSVPQSSLVIIMGSFGVHAQGKSAVSGSLLPEDMYVPVWIIQV